MKKFNETMAADLAQLLDAGGLAAFPTDTVYGLGVAYGSLEALDRLKHAKHRPETKPIPFMTDSLDHAAQIAYINETAKKLADSFLPGPLTLILKRRESVSDEYTNGMETVAVRIPDEPYLLEVMRKVGRPLLVSSANQSGEPAALTAKQAMDALPDIDAVVQGACAGGVASTIVDCTGDDIRILREGPISEERLREVL